MVRPLKAWITKRKQKHIARKRPRRNIAQRCKKIKKERREERK